VKVTFI